MDQNYQEPLVEPIVNKKGDKNYRVHSLNNGIVTIEAQLSLEERQKRAKERIGSIAMDPMSKRTYSLATREMQDTMKLISNAKRLCRTPTKLSWHHIKFEVEVLATPEQSEAMGGVKYFRQEIVKDASGYAAPGQALYIMGSSGAGKTSLLNILSDRVRLINKATLSGNILINDVVPVNQENFARFAAYVMQDDVLFSHFTVKEALTFAARLKLTTDEQH